MSGYEYGSLAGFIFMCNSNTKPQCYQYRVFGLPFEGLETARQVKCGTKLFLYDFQLKLLYGIYEATSSGHLNIQPNAFGGRFPSQVSFRIYKDCLPLPETVFRHAIRENYNGSKFRQELGSEQVKALMELFQPIYSVATYSRELHQQSTSYQRLPPLPQGWYYPGMQQTGHPQDSAYFYQQYGQQTPQRQVAGPHSETQNVNVHPPHFQVNDPYRRDGNQQQLPLHHTIAAAAAAQAPQDPPMLHQLSPSYHYNTVAAQSTAQSQTYAVPHQGDGGGPGHGLASTNEAYYYAYYGAQPHPQNSGHHVYKQQQQQQQPPSHEYQQHHGI